MVGLGQSDAPVASAENDSLGLAPYATALGDFIKHCDTPITVAIQGDWGTGKTSLMNMVREHLSTGEGASSIDTIWFATWQYAQFGATDTLSVSLLSTLLRKISGDDETLLKSSMNVLKKLARPAANIGLKMATAGVVGADDLGGGGADPVDLAGNAEELKEDIAKLVAEKRAKGIERIVVFVDDLDRVPPARAVEILETIKLFVDLESCVFCLALDYAVVRRGLKEKFGVAEDDLGGRSFFDKIIQLPFSIPTARYDTDRFILGLFGQMSLKMGEDDGELFARLARASVSANPRGIKRVFNSLQLLVGMARTQSILTGDQANDRLMVRNLFALLCMQNRFEPVHDWLVFNASRLTAGTLSSIDGTLNEEVEIDEKFAAALNRLDEQQARQFGEFARAFVSAIQDPDADENLIDEDELSRFQRALTLTRVTSVGEDQKGALPNDPEFRLGNRALLKKLQEEYNTAEASGNPFKVWQPHSESMGSLFCPLDEGEWYSLCIFHGENDVSVCVEAAQKRINAKKNLIREELGSTASVFDDSESGNICLFHHTFDNGANIEKREDFLRNEVLPLYMNARAALKGKLD